MNRSELRVDVDAERCSPRHHETSLAVWRVQKSSAAVCGARKLKRMMKGADNGDVNRTSEKSNRARKRTVHRADRKSPCCTRRPPFFHSPLARSKIQGRVCTDPCLQSA